jgi:hypothetical protein
MKTDRVSASAPLFNIKKEYIHVPGLGTENPELSKRRELCWKNVRQVTI